MHCQSMLLILHGCTRTRSTHRRCPNTTHSLRARSPVAGEVHGCAALWTRRVVRTLHPRGVAAKAMQILAVVCRTPFLPLPAWAEIDQCHAHFVERPDGELGIR